MHANHACGKEQFHQSSGGAQSAARGPEPSAQSPDSWSHFYNTSVMVDTVPDDPGASHSNMHSPDNVQGLKPLTPDTTLGLKLLRNCSITSTKPVQEQRVVEPKWASTPVPKAPPPAPKIPGVNAARNAARRLMWPTNKPKLSMSRRSSGEGHAHSPGPWGAERAFSRDESLGEGASGRAQLPVLTDVESHDGSSTSYRMGTNVADGMQSMASGHMEQHSPLGAQPQHGTSPPGMPQHNVHLLNTR